MRTDLKPWGQPGDEARKARYDSGGKRIGEDGFDQSQMNLFAMVQKLAEEMPEMTPAQRRMAMIVTGVLVVSLLTSCTGMPIEDGQGQTNAPDSGNDTQPTSIWTQPASEMPTVVVIAPTPVGMTEVVPSVTHIATPTETARPGVCDDSPAQLQAQGNTTEILGNPQTSWQPVERENIVDAFGQPIYPDVLRIANSGSAAGLVPIGVAIGGPEVGGYSVMFVDSSSWPVWPKVQDETGQFVPAARSDANGNLTPNQWQKIPRPEIGRMTPWMQRVDNGSCAYLASTLEDGKVVGVYQPMSNTWRMEEVGGGVDIKVAVSQLGLNSDRAYELREGYLIDTYNQAKMAKWENNTWTTTSLEEKYGHFVSPDSGLLSSRAEYSNSGAVNIELACVSNGNVWSNQLQLEINGSTRIVNTIEGECVFRDNGGRLHMVKGVFSATEEGMDPFINVLLTDVGIGGGISGSTDQVAINPNVNPEVGQMGNDLYLKKVIYRPGETLVLVIPEVMPGALGYQVWGYGDDATEAIQDQQYSNVYQYLARTRYSEQWVRDFIASVGRVDRDGGEMDYSGTGVLPTLGARVIRNWDWVIRQVYP